LLGLLDDLACWVHESLSPLGQARIMSARQNNRGVAEAAKRITAIRNFEVVRDGDHLVQFYEDDKFLIDSLATFVAQGFVEEQSVVLILTPEHRAGLEKKLRAADIDPADYNERGLYFAYDAADTLACFMVEGQPNPRRFRATIEPIITVASQQGSVRAFGEMVALLWAEGNKTGALELEMLWNDLMEQNSFALLCAYPISKFNEAEKDRELRHICRAHNCVIPHESYADPYLAR
jgi:hypothetical protein